MTSSPRLADTYEGETCEFTIETEDGHDEGVRPKDEGVHPKDEGVRPKDEGVSQEDEVVPQKDEVLPQKKEVLPQKKEVLPHGMGRKVYRDGSYYDGEWARGKEHGYGVYVEKVNVLLGVWPLF